MLQEKMSLGFPISAFEFRDNTANHIFSRSLNLILISKCMFNGHRIIEHEENVFRMVNLYR